MSKFRISSSLLIVSLLILLISMAIPVESSNTPMSNQFAANTNQENTSPLMLAHYMAWYQAPSVSGFWGWHWTMNHFNPNHADENDRPEIASHYMPLTGPYDSSDEAVLEYQVLLMKMSGVDGVIVDWYGAKSFRDYVMINEATGKLFEYIQKADLKFVICYEDQSILHQVNEGVLTREEGLVEGQNTMTYLQENWFGSEAYVKTNGQPLLFVFGPQYFKGSPDWETMFNDLEATPALITLDKHRVVNQIASYPWPPMQGGITYNQIAIETYLNEFYRRAIREDFIVASAFPGFHDIYAEAEVQSSYGYLDAENGETFRMTLDVALAQNPDIVQLVTWNDYGEGTIIEPTEEFGYQYLAMIQELKGETWAFSQEDLELPLQLFKLRKQYQGNAEVNAELDKVFTALINEDTATAREILAVYAD